MIFGKHNWKKHNRDSAWAAFESLVRLVMPREEANRLLLHARKEHDRRWNQHERLRHEIRHRKIVEDDYE